MNPFNTNPNPNPTPDPNPDPQPNPNQRRSNQYKNFGKQKTRQENLRDKYKKQIQRAKVETHDHVKILTMNVNSVHGYYRSQITKLAIEESSPDIAILTETKLGPLSNTFNVPGYQIQTQADRKIGAGGIMILSKLGLDVIEATSRSLEAEEIQVAKCKFGDLTIIGIYRSPTILKDDDDKDVLENISKTKAHHACIINWLTSEMNKLGNKRFVLTGDFNLKDLAEANFDPPGLRLADDEEQNQSNDHKWVNMIHKFGLTQNVKDATHISAIGGPSTLDLVLTPPQTEIRTLVVDPGAFGGEFDHFAVEFSIEMNFKTENKLRLVRKPTKESWDKIRAELAERDLVKNFWEISRKRKTKWDMNRAPNQEEDPFNPLFLDVEDEYPNPYENAYEEAENDVADYYTKTFTEIYKKHTPEVVVKPPPPGGELDTETKRNIRHSKRLHKTIKWAAINGSWNEERLANAKEKLRILIKKNKTMVNKDRVDNEIRKLQTSEKKQKNFFDHMKSFQKKQSTEGPIKDKKGDLKTSDEDIADTFNTNLGDQLQHGEKPDVDWSKTNLKWMNARGIYKPEIEDDPFHPKHFDPQGTYKPEDEETLNGKYITAADVYEQIKAANRGAAPGPDELPMEFYAQTKEIISLPLALLYNLIGQTGRVPEAFKITKVKMLYKKKAKDDPQNYRPLSMSNHSGKIWEKIMNLQLKTHLEKFGLLSSRQHGFRNGMGTTTNLLQLWEKIIETVEREGALCEMWSFDLTKAFDLLDHAKVLDLLHQMGITGNFGRCIESWLTGRQQYVEVNGTKSKKVTVGKSCVQGSIFGPTLWLVYIQPLMDRLTKMGVEYYGYADDIAIIKRIKTDQDQTEFEAILRALQEWADEFGMRWSPAKTQRLVFKYKGCKPLVPREVEFNGVKITPLEATAESLGLLIGSSCIFTAHIRRIRDKIKTIMYQVKRNFAILHPEILKKIYLIYIQSRIDYGSAIYYPGVEKLVKPVENIVQRYWKLSPTRKPPANLMSPQMRMIENDLKIVHKMYKGNYALKYEEIFKTNREIEKEFITRKNETNDLPIPKWRLTIARQKFSFRTRPGWNFIPTRIRELKESLFKIEIKKHILDNEQTYRNFTRDHNIVGGTERNETQKKKAIEENQKTDSLKTRNTRRKRNKKKETKQPQSQLNENQVEENAEEDEILINTTTTNPEPVQEEENSEEGQENEPDTETRDAERKRKKKKALEQTQKNPYLRRNCSDGRNLIRITQPRIRMVEEATATTTQALP